MTGATTSAEIYDVTTDTWTPAAPTAVGHAGALAVRLQDGRVLVAGGHVSRRDAPISTVEIYDPAANTWTAGPPLTMPRERPQGGLMFDGRVIVVSSDPVTAEVSAEEYLPGASAWNPIAAPATPAVGASALVFDDGQCILVAGRDRGDALLTMAESYKLNHRPVAVGSVATPAVQGLPGGKAAIDVSAFGSSDADGDRLTYTWTEGATILARTNDPAATLGLGVGSHTITLTVADVFDETSTASVVATVADGTAGLAELVASLTRDLRDAQQRKAVCEATIVAADTAVELAWKLQFRDGSFKLPGGTPALKLASFVAASLAAPASCQKDVYRMVGGKK